MRDITDILSDFIEMAEERAWEVDCEGEVLSCAYCGASNGNLSTPEHKEDCTVQKLIGEARGINFWTKTSEALPEKWRIVVISWPFETRLAYYLGTSHSHSTGWREYPRGVSIAAPKYWAYVPHQPTDE